MNVVCMDGRLGKDPELRYTPTGKAVCNFTIANDLGFGDKKTTNWHRVVAWNGQAEAIGQYLGKGSRVGITGELTNRSWEDREGVKRFTTEIRARTIDFLSPKNGTGEKTFDGPPTDPPAGGPMDIPEDDIPF